MAKPSLDDLVTPTPASWARDFRVPKMPSLRDAVSGKTLLDGLASHDQAAERWRQDMERSISDRLTQTTATTVSPTATAAATTTPVTVAPISSVNGKTGTVVLTTDDIPEGVTNSYLSPENFSEAFLSLGTNRNYLAFGVTWPIPAQRNAVIYGPFTVDGLLQVSGHLAFLG